MPQVNELGSSFNNAHENYDVSLLIKLDISEILDNLNLNDIFGVDTRIVAHVINDGEKRRETRELVDDRTIFMTFSKDCPVYENELREFFTRYHFRFIYLCRYSCIYQISHIKCFILLLLI